MIENGGKVALSGLYASFACTRTSKSIPYMLYDAKLVEKYPVYDIWCKTRRIYALADVWQPTAEKNEKRKANDGTKKERKNACARRGLNTQPQFSLRASTPLTSPWHNIRVVLTSHWHNTRVLLAQTTFQSNNQSSKWRQPGLESIFKPIETHTHPYNRWAYCYMLFKMCTGTPALRDKTAASGI